MEQLFFAQILEVALYCLKYLGDGTGTQCPLTEHILLTRICFQFHTLLQGGKDEATGIREESVTME